MSVVLRMGLRTGEQKLIVIMGAVAATEALRRFGVAAQIKWPNDVVVGSTGRGPLRVKKLGGLLVERVSVGDGADAHVLGLGLNVNQAEEELPPGAAVRATSMRVEQGRRFDRNEVCRAVLEELNAWYRRLAMGQPERILARWRRLSCLLGRVVRVRVEGRELGGRAIGIRSTGELIFRDETGRDLLLRDGTAQLLL